jgi:hypothetical protein
VRAFGGSFYWLLDFAEQKYAPLLSPADAYRWTKIELEKRCITQNRTTNPHQAHGDDITKHLQGRL